MTTILAGALSAQGFWQSANLDLPRTRIPVSAFRGALAQPTLLAGPAVEGTISVPPERNEGLAMRTSLNDWYYRLHVIPIRIDLGNLVTNQVRLVKIWSAYFQPQHLESVVMENGEGIDLTGPGAPPLEFGPLQMRGWQLAVGTEGPPVIAATLTYRFTGLGDRTIVVTGNRMSAWMLPPDWAQPVIESLEWLTEVQQSASGGEARYQWREAPRRSWEFTVIADRRERQVLEHAVFDWSARTWALPVWPDVTWLKAPLSLGVLSIPVPEALLMDFRVGGLAMIWRDVTHYELVEVQAITSDQVQLVRPTANAWEPGARVLPCRTARITDAPSLERISDQVMRSTVRLAAVEVCDWPATAPSTMYRGVPVLEQRPDLDQPQTTEFGRQLVLIDGATGPIVVDDFTGRAWPVQSHAWQVWGRRERAALRGLLYWLKGRAEAVWIPSWADDLQLVEPALSTASGIVVAWAGVARFGRAQPGRRHLRIELNDGRVIYRQLSVATELDSMREHLQLDTPVGMALEPSAVRLISWMLLARLTSDTVELSHEHDSEGVARSRVSFAGIPAEEEAL
ncbi:MAG: hypothetical protein ACRER3_00210 [Pseudomonas fluorescens]